MNHLARFLQDLNPVITRVDNAFVNFLAVGLNVRLLMQ